MKEIAEHKAFRSWTYIVIVLITVALFVCFGGEFFKGIADLVRATQGR